jgi:glycosyltransferase involved in cell wall biosynthesis
VDTPNRISANLERIASHQMLSVVLATHNGARTLPRTLNAMISVKAPISGWNLIVVDNASEDDTASISRAFMSRLPLQVLHHPVRGKNSALNFALEHAVGDFIVFTDDDVVPDEDWLVALEAAANACADYDIFGGHILPCWDRNPPPWILDAVPLGVTYGLTDPALPSGEIYPGLVWGANMMVRRKLFDEGLRFDATIGPTKGQYVMGSETDFNLRAGARGHKCWFCPTAKVRHIIRPYQLERRWIMRRAFRFGRSQYHQHRTKVAQQKPLVLGVPRWEFRRLVQAAVSATVWRLCFATRKFVAAWWDVNMILGKIYQARLERRVPVDHCDNTPS